jgi:hypothetical protein
LNKIYINGKFLSQRTTGVQRFAYGIVKALDRSLQLLPSANKFILLLPPDALPIVGLQVIQQRNVGLLFKSLTAWEQFELPIYFIMLVWFDTFIGEKGGAYNS